MGDDQIIKADGREIESVGVMGLEPRGGVRGVRFATLTQESKHSVTEVYCVGMDMWIGCKELSEEATVSVSEDQCVVIREEPREVVGAAVLQSVAEGKVFEPAIRAGDKVEVGWGGSHVHWLKWYRVEGVLPYGARCHISNRDMGTCFTSGTE